MLRVLLVKTSSLGDVVHNFPVVSDIRNHFPAAAIDWIVEEAYVPLVRLHPAVRKVIPVALRRWRGRVLDRGTWQDVRTFRHLSRAEQYDAIIDTQGLIKSALISHSARGRRHGFDADCARERLAARLYDITHHVPVGQHAVTRNRQLAGAALGYRAGDKVDYGLQQARVEQEMDGPYCLFLHGTSRSDKLWPVQHWIDLGQDLKSRGISCVLPWGSEAERERSGHIAHALGQATLPPLMGLEQLAFLLSGAAFVVGVDTGLVHLAAALGVPVAAIYVATDPGLTGVFCCPKSRNLGGAGTAVLPQQVLDALAELKAL